jgi:hypothetical protein
MEPFSCHYRRWQAPGHPSRDKSVGREFGALSGECHSSPARGWGAGKGCDNPARAQKTRPAKRASRARGPNAPPDNARRSGRSPAEPYPPTLRVQFHTSGVRRQLPATVKYPPTPPTPRRMARWDRGRRGRRVFQVNCKKWKEGKGSPDPSKIRKFPVWGEMRSPRKAVNSSPPLPGTQRQFRRGWPPLHQ